MNTDTRRLASHTRSWAEQASAAPAVTHIAGVIFGHTLQREAALHASEAIRSMKPTIAGVNLYRGTE